jgi:hypothetical protein
MEKKIGFFFLPFLFFVILDSGFGFVLSIEVFYFSGYFLFSAEIYTFEDFFLSWLFLLFFVV